MQENGLQNEHIVKALQASGIGTWHWDTGSGKFYADSLAGTLFGFTNTVSHFSDVAKRADKKDRLLADTAFNTALTTGAINLKYQTPYNLLHVKGQRVTNDNGTTTFYGTVQAILYEDNTSFLKRQSALQDIIEESTVAIGLYVGRDLVIGLANSVMLNFWGKDNSVIGKPLAEGVPELEGQPFLQILDNVYTTGQTYQITDGAANLALNGMFSTYYFDFTYKPLFDENNNVYAILNTAINVTDRVFSKQKMQLSESRFRAITEQSPVAIGLLYGENFVVEIANDRILEIWGKDKSVIGLPIIEALPEIKGQGFLELLQGVYTTGIPYNGNDVLAKLVKDDVIRDIYVDFAYTPLKNETGNIIGVMVLATDVTQKVKTLREIAASEEKFRSLIYSAQAAVAVFTGYNLVADIANDAFLQFVGRTTNEFVGKPLLESMPEMYGQESIRLMHEVFEKGIKTHHYGRQVNIMRNGALTLNYYNVSYTPLYDADGSIYAVLDIAIDVTENVKTQQALAEADATLRGAIELAELGTWTYNPITREVEYSDRILEWFGFDGNTENYDTVFNPVHPDDRARIQIAIDAALQPGSEGIYDEVYTIINKQTGREKILHAQAKTFFDEKGKPYILRGTTQDITAQKKLQLALENEVKERTEALQKANYELEDANQRLINSNEELAQYAYVASHDLQEPLRKISMFSNLLKEKDAANKNSAIIDKIIGSSQRMSLLIKDLLEFSRLLSPDSRYVKTDLNTIVQAVTNDFELLIEEKSADIITDNLPVIDAVPLQMNQLFYNLMGNALKFVPDGTTPKISVLCHTLQPQDVKQYISNPNNTEYYKISIADNGIGIDKQYQKQIFEVFKRLHTRSEYSGSGIGLAICRRIATNHQGVIYAESESGRGTTFTIILPKNQ